MGKWTTGYYDDVLGSKIKSLVSGAIIRSKLEKTEPEINFERFVEELDAGDSFTTSLFDILVKELADRQSRSNVDDRQLIGERTAKSLRMITSSNRVYFSTSFSHRTAARTRSHLPTYLTAPPEEIDWDDEDELHALLNSDPASRRQHDVVTETAGATTALPSLATRSLSPGPIPSTDEVPTYSPTWVPSRSYPNSGSNLSRSSSLRRPTRSRTVDFNDFTSRRRSTIRNYTESGGGGGGGSSASTDALTASDTRDRDNHSWVPIGSTRRFFGLSRIRRSNPELNLWSDLPESEDGLAGGGNTVLPYIPTSSSSTSTSSPHGIILPSPSETDGQNVDSSTTSASNRVLPRAPRLRRGELRHLESSLSRQASPAETVVLPDDYGSSRRAPSPPEISGYVVESFDTHRFGLGALSSPPIQEGGGNFGEREVGATFGIVETAAYPTPGSPGSTVDN
ncbi:hypothetical protein F5890DRAFT_1546954 [Lentinula detonsa]|uniref:Uncharacterized protein n=1 Tax=Lentinula detonsa TaxID=2804962 RepID=A0AA38PPL3_9AGAR|nr:hypothetical protein F5890DRAFT_1546954 [Lentinula detonsa]